MNRATNQVLRDWFTALFCCWFYLVFSTGCTSLIPSLMSLDDNEHQNPQAPDDTFTQTNDILNAADNAVAQITTDMNEAQVGIQAWIYIEPGDDVIHVEQAYVFSNLSNVTWRAPTIRAQLAANAKNLRITRQTSGISARDVIDRAVVIQGDVQPGEEEVGIQFDIPLLKKNDITLQFPLISSIAAVQVITAFRPNLQVHVPGFANAGISRNQKGQRMITWQYIVSSEIPPIRSVTVHVNGLLKANRARWVAVGCTLALMLAGVVSAFWFKSKIRKTVDNVTR